jgi:hypothetical protein
MIIRSNRSRRQPGFLESGRIVPAADPHPGWDSLKEELVCEVLALVDQVDRLAPADDLADVAVRLVDIEVRLVRLQGERLKAEG